MTTYEILYVISQYLILLAAVIYTVFACFQWRAIRRQADIAARSMAHTERLERPWIMFTDVNWGLPTSQTSGFGEPMKWSAKNVGRSPVFLSKLAVGANVVPYPISIREPNYPEAEPFANFVLPPYGIHTSQFDVTIDASQMQQIFNGKACLLFFGVADYSDSFGEIHRTRFSCYWHLEAGKWHFEPVGPPSHMQYS